MKNIYIKPNIQIILFNNESLTNTQILTSGILNNNTYPEGIGSNKMEIMF